MYSELVPTSERISSSTSQKKIGVIVKVARVFDCFNTMNADLSLAQLSRDNFLLVCLAPGLKRGGINCVSKAKSSTI